jgi:hypothetical protein
MGVVWCLGRPNMVLSQVVYFCLLGVPFVEC